MKLGGSLKRTRKRGARRGRARAGKRASGGGRTGRTAWIVLGLLVGGWALGYLVATRAVFPAPPPPGDMFEVPDLRGEGLEEARQALSGAGLELGEVDSLQHPSATRGTVLGQVPLPGQLALAGAAVRVTVSIGAQEQTVPEIVGLDADQARTVLEASGFTVVLDSVQAPFPRGRVVRASPPPNSIVGLPTEVRLGVSRGPALVVMPLVLGLEEDEARFVLDSLGFVVEEVEEVFRFGRDQGVVVEQEPAANTEVEPGAAVRLAVGRRGRGEPTARVPNP